MQPRLAPLLTAALLPQFAAAQQPPNIILFLVDDMGWQETSVPFYKERTPLNDRYRTPNMERLARQGVKFTRAYACPVSSPSRCSLLTGMNAARHRVTNWVGRYNQDTNAPGGNLTLPQWSWNGIQPATTTHPDDLPHSTLATTLPQLLSQAGYHTIHCGKGNFGAGYTSGANPANLGFHVNIAGSGAGFVTSPSDVSGLNKRSFAGTALPAQGNDYYVSAGHEVDVTIGYLSQPYAIDVNNPTVPRMSGLSGFFFGTQGRFKTTEKVVVLRREFHGVIEISLKIPIPPFL